MMDIVINSSKSNPMVDENGRMYGSIRELAREIHAKKERISKQIKSNGVFVKDGHRYYLASFAENLKLDGKNSIEQNVLSDNEKKEFQEFQEYKNVKGLQFETFDFKFIDKKCEYKYCVALFSDAHIEETVLPESVMGLNEYNTDIAEKRVMSYFNNLAICLNKDGVDELLFASLGDTISGYIHPELEQTNGKSPLEATLMAQNLIYNGLRFICEHTKLKKITFVGIVGNHSRTTKKVQYNNGYRMSYEWLMYQNIKKQCELTGLPIEFCIPESEIAVVNMPDGKRFIFNHGEQVKSSSNATVCGVYPALNRLAMKWHSVFNQDKIYMGHFHTAINMPNCTVNASIIGYNAFALSNGMPYEKPSQQYELYDVNMGLILTRQIYCD